MDGHFVILKESTFTPFSGARGKKKKKKAYLIQPELTPVGIGHQIAEPAVTLCKKWQLLQGCDKGELKKCTWPVSDWGLTTCQSHSHFRTSAPAGK